MKLHFLDRSNPNQDSFSVKKSRYPYFLRIWHYHSELELVLIEKSQGTRFIGDSIESFKEGDVVLIGENLPHMWLNDDKFFSETHDLVAEASAVHFKKDFLGKSVWNSSELVHISELMDRARYGIKFIDLNEKTKDRIKLLNDLDGFERLMEFFYLLDELAMHKQFKTLANQGYVNEFKRTSSKNLDKVYEYIFKNFNKSLSLNEVAQVASMNPSAFSRFFKRINRKTFNDYVNEIRIGYACRLLIENEYNIARICYESGFNNISNFNRQFKKIMSQSPSEYLQQHSQK